MDAPSFPRDDQDPGVPEALPRTLELLERRVGAEAIDRLWVFPPLIRSRREWGLVAAGCFGDHPGLRRLVTARYEAELSGSGLRFEPSVDEEGAAPPERLPRVMEGVVRRSRLALGEPVLVEIGGDPSSLSELLEGLQPPEALRSGNLVFNARERPAT